MSLAKRILSWISKHGSKPKALPILGGMSIGDFFLPALPTQTSVMLLAWLQPKTGVKIILTFALAAALGSTLLIGFGHLIDGYVSSAIPNKGTQFHDTWQQLTLWIDGYGLWALFFMSMLPTPPRTLILLSLISGIFWPYIIVVVFIGKLIWFTLVVTLVIKAPNWLLSLPWLGPKLTPILTRRDA